MKHKHSRRWVPHLTFGHWYLVSILISFIVVVGVEYWVGPPELDGWMLLVGLIVAPVFPFAVIGLPITLIWLLVELAKSGVAFARRLRMVRRGGQSEVDFSWEGFEGRAARVVRLVFALSMFGFLLFKIWDEQKAGWASLAGTLMLSLSIPVAVIGLAWQIRIAVRSPGLPDLRSRSMLATLTFFLAADLLMLHSGSEDLYLGMGLLTQADGWLLLVAIASGVAAGVFKVLASEGQGRRTRSGHRMTDVTRPGQRMISSGARPPTGPIPPRPRGAARAGAVRRGRP